MKKEIQSRAVVYVHVALCILIQIKTVQSHGTLTIPPPRQPESLYWYQVGCVIGCTCSGSGKEQYPTLESLDCLKPAEPTILDSEQLTWNANGNSPRSEWNKYMPWRSPGSAVPLDSCGIASGFLPNASEQYPHKFTDETIQQGTKGTDLPQGTVTEWEVGSVVEASYYLTVNHGGGYQYRVCPTNDDSPLNEECFEANPLQFASSEHIVKLGSSKEFTIPAMDVTEGVRPQGSTWRRLPIPACNCDLGSGCSTSSTDDSYQSYEQGTPYGKCTTGLQFEADHITNGLWPEGYGYYVATLGGDDGSGNSTPCQQHQDSTTCATDTTNGCKWYVEKEVCYETRVTSSKEEKCAVHNGDEATCVITEGCLYYGNGKNVCYSETSNNRRRTKETYSTNTKNERQEWHIVDQLIAPSTPGTYVLQWRWDNEQTPQIWTTCADILVKSDDTTSDASSLRRKKTGYDAYSMVLTGIMMAMPLLF
eukprot:CAMPEP_0195293008 /NCGR_PEP_ID=MMETSP0707-20130614/11408_1 /TAXON_ID=33640 /ORGANISM="Asterionellopsis glacialis, Strain CCMP134" /LENGTH=477 /DNA_ID=CAMNT_0040353615 /DNA_START=69 /DNA_END=1502 /DNA_ORIENTATION=+